jgi:hypothetical protein
MFLAGVPCRQIGERTDLSPAGVAAPQPQSRSALRDLDAVDHGLHRVVGDVLAVDQQRGDLADSRPQRRPPVRPSWAQLVVGGVNHRCRALRLGFVVHGLEPRDLVGHRHPMLQIVADGMAGSEQSGGVGEREDAVSGQVGEVAVVVGSCEHRSYC